MDRFSWSFTSGKSHPKLGCGGYWLAQTLNRINPTETTLNYMDDDHELKLDQRSGEEPNIIHHFPYQVSDLLLDVKRSSAHPLRFIIIVALLVSKGL
ncbi:hypothetical protein VNO77_27889 [Canavalia gladiata]|uniref:Uncharacterized protein n=1 Tax=Canavalia gladiata TaxID=3824 RepID=A0AAN9KWM8_CANGL